MSCSFLYILTKIYKDDKIPYYILNVEFAMGKFKDNCKKYVGMTAIAALSLFGGANEAQAKSNNDGLYHVGTSTYTITNKDYNITDSISSYHSAASMTLYRGKKMDEMFFRSFSEVHNLGDGYTYVSKSEEKMKNGQMKRKDFDYDQYMITPDGRKLDCSFFDSGKFMLPEITHVKRDGSYEVETHSADEVRAHNLKMEIKFKQQARKNGFTEEDVAHFSKVIQRTRRSLEGGDIGRPTDHYIESVTEAITSSYSTNNKDNYKEEKGQMTANFLDFVKNNGGVYK